MKMKSMMEIETAKIERMTEELNRIVCANMCLSHKDKTAVINDCVKRALYEE